MVSLPEYVVLDQGLERLPLEELRSLQSRRLVNMVRYVYEETDFWRRKFARAGLTPGDIKGLEDLSRIPFCTKDELQADQSAHPPFGSYLGTDPTKWVRFFATSGTTGMPLRRVFSRRDWGYVLDRFQRRSIIGPGDICVILGPTDGLMGPSAGLEGLQRCGALVIPAGRFSTRAKIELLCDVRPTTVSGSASYLLHLVDVAGEMGVELPALGIKGVMSVGEPGAAIAATRDRLASGWGARVVDGYGLTEIFPLGGNCPHSAAIHVASDLAVTEIVAPDGDAQLPMGTPGEVVYTNLVSDTQPLLRYRTRDVARVTTEEPCGCGFTGTRLAEAIEGRVDDMIWFRGANIFPSAIEAIVRDFPQLASEFRIVLDGSKSLAKMTIEVEPRERLPASGITSLAENVGGAVRDAIRVNAEISIVEPGTLPPADGVNKAQRVVDNRAA